LRFLRLTGAQEKHCRSDKAENFALAAVWLARIATTAPCQNQPVTPICQWSRGISLIKSCSIFHWILLFRQAEALREPNHVCIHDDPFVFVKSVPEDDVGGFAANAGQRYNFSCVRHFAAVFLHDFAHGSANTFRFVAIESSGLNAFSNSDSAACT